MMSDYERTMELVSAANNSAGSSQEQFDKTLESLDSKLKRLSDAWQLFTMGIMNSDFVKAGVDILTNILTAVNDLTGSFGNLGTLVSRVGLIIGALVIGKKVITALSKSLDGPTGLIGMITKAMETAKTAVSKTGKQAGEEFSSRATSSIKSNVTEFYEAGKAAGEAAKQGVESAYNAGLSQAVPTTIQNEESKAKVEIPEKFELNQKQKETLDLKTKVELEGLSEEDLKKERKRIKKLKTKYESNSRNFRNNTQLTDNQRNQVDLFYGSQLGLQEIDAEIERRKNPIPQTPQVDAPDVQTKPQASPKQEQPSVETPETKPQKVDPDVALSYEKTSKAIYGAAAAASVLGMGLSAVAVGFENSGNEKAAQSFDAVASSVSGLGVVLGLLPTILSAIGTGAMAAMPWIAGIAAGIAAFVAIVKIVDINTETEAEKLERLTTEAEESAAAYDNILKKSEELASNRQAYEDMQNDFENLTKGTKEWRDALVEANQQVLELVSTYPELANYISRDSDGQLIITDAGWKELEDAQANAERYGYIAKQTDEIQKRRQIARLGEENLNFNIAFNTALFDEAITRRGIEDAAYASSVVTSELKTNLVDAVKEGIEFKDLDIEEIKEKLSTIYEVDSDALDETAQAILNYNNTVLAQASAVQDANMIMLQGALESSDYKDSKFAQTAVSVFSKKDSITDEEIDQKLIELNNVDIAFKDASSKGLPGLQKYITDTFDLTAEDVGETIWNDMSALKVKIAELHLGDELIADFEKYLAYVEEQIGKYEAIGTTGVTYSDFTQSYSDYINGIANTEDYNILTTILSQFEDLDEPIKDALENIVGEEILVEGKNVVLEGVEEQRIDETRKRVSAYYEAEENSGSRIIRSRHYTNEKMKELSADQYESYLGMLRNVIANSETNKDEIGEAVANFFEESIIGVVDDMDLSSIMDNLSSFDFNTEQGLLDFENYLRDLGYAVPADQIDGLIEKLKELGGAANNISFDQAIEKSKVLRDARETLESDGDLTEEQMEALIETGKFERDNFIRTLDGYKLTGMDIKTAIETIGGEIINALTQGAENDRKKEEVGETFRNRVENSDLSDSEKNRLLTGTATEDEILAFYGGSSNIPSQARDSIIAQYERESGAVGFKADPNADLTSASTAFQIGTQNLTPNELLNFDLTSFKEQNNIIGEAADLIDKNYTNALINAANESDDFKVALKAQIKMLEENEDAFDENQKKVLKAADNYLKTQNAIKNFSEAISGNMKALSDATPEEYAKNINKIAEEASIFLNSDITSEFVKENLTAFQQLAEGGETADIALQNLIERANQISVLDLLPACDQFYEIAKSMGYSKKEAFDLYNSVTALDGVDINLDGTFDNTDIIMGLTKIFGSVDKVNAYLDSLNSDFKLEIVGYKTIKDKSALSGLGYNPNNTPELVIPIYGVRRKSVDLNYGGNAPDISEGKSTSTPSISKPSEVGENPYDKLFNLTRQLNEELRQRNELERQFSEMEDGVYYKYNSETGTFDKMTASAKERLTLLNEQERSLERQAALYGEIAKTAKESAENLYNENLDLLENYLTKGEDGSFTVNIDAFETWEKDLKETFNNLEAERIRLENLGDKAKETEITNHNTAVEEYEKEQEELNSIRDIIEKILSYLDESYDAEDNQAQLAAQYEALQEQNRQDAIEFLNRVMDAVIADRQKEIDELSNINDSINDTNSRILEGIQDQIDLQRRQRDNQKKENEIEEKQRRLDYLRQDTSNANDLAIKQLEKEIAEQQEDYTDTLIDQKISDLQDQNDAAAEQRERQIELMQSQLDWQIENGELWGEVSRLIEEGFDENGNIIKDSELWNLMSKHEGYKSMSSIEQEFWVQELEKLKSKFDNYVNQLQDPDNDNEIEGRPTPEGEFEFRDTKGQIKRGKKDEDGSVRLTEGDYTTEYSDFTWDPATGYQAGAERTRFNAAEKNWARDEDGNWIINDNEGNALKDQWISYKDNEYYMDKEGKLATGWKKLDDKWYYFDPIEGATQGALKTGWLEQNGVWYYLDTEGANRGEMYTGEREIDGKIHVFAENGAWLYEKKNEGANGDPDTPDKPDDKDQGTENTGGYSWNFADGSWILNKDGKPTSKGWHTLPDGHSYHVADEKGNITIGWLQDGEKWYYLNGISRDGFPVGAMLKGGKFSINGTEYEFGSDGLWVSGDNQGNTGNSNLYTGGFKNTDLLLRDASGNKTSTRVSDIMNSEVDPESGYRTFSNDDGTTFRGYKAKVNGSVYYIPSNAIVDLEKFKELQAFKTGGLADFTGPAWLDGTKSRPELVLNQEDTQNFIKLKDVLSSFMDNVRVSGGSSNKSSGDNYFDIDIAVDEIASDYDVDQLAERIKKTIYEDSLYRNVNMLSFHR